MRTIACCTILVAMVILCCFAGGEASRWRYRLFWFKRSIGSECTYSGYKPGGGIPGIKPIQSPVAKAQKNALAFLAGKIKPHSTMGKELTNGAKVFLEIFTKVAPKLAASFGIFSAALGVLEAFTKPSQDDLMNNVNKALKELTEDVNNRLKKMEGYVDGRVIELEKRLMANDYRTLHRYCIDCLRQFNEEDGLDCQRNANRLIYAYQPHFQPLGDRFRANAQVAPSYYDIKRLEAGLVPFRDYAALHVYTLQVLIESLENTTYEGASFYQKKFRQHLAKSAMSYYKYSHWAYNWIVKQQIETNANRAIYGNPKYEEKKEIWEGFGIGVHTADAQDIKPQCTEDTKTAINDCKVHLTIRVDGKRPHAYHARYFHNVPTKHYEEALIAYGKILTKDICKSYLNGLERDIKAYWHTELLDVAEGWKEVAMKAKEELKKI